jgi:hypothetical protein
VADQGGDVDLPLGDQPQEGLLEALDAPAVRQLRGDSADLGADELHAVVVELISQAQADAVALVEAGGDHAAAHGDRAQGLVQGRVGAADLDGEVGAEMGGGLADAFGDRIGAGVECVMCAIPLGGLQAAVQCVDGGHPGAVELREPGGEQADDALAEHGDVLAEVDIAGQDGVVSDSADPGEGAGQGLEPGGQGVAGHALGGDDALAAVSPDAPHQVAGVRHPGGAGQVRGDLDDLADLGVAPSGHRVLDAGRALPKEPGLGVPGARQVGVGAPVGGELGAGRDA